MSETETNQDPDMSWFDIAVDKFGNVTILNCSSGWSEFILEPNWEDNFQADAPDHLTPGAYRWTDFKINGWDEGEQMNISAGRFIKHEPPEAPSEVPLVANTWLRSGSTVYTLISSGFRRGVEQFQNRFSLAVVSNKDEAPDAGEKLAEHIRQMLEADRQKNDALFSAQPVEIDPSTNRPVDDHGPAELAIEYALEEQYHDNDVGNQLAFLENWVAGTAAEEWPEFYPWLADRERAILQANSATDAEA